MSESEIEENITTELCKQCGKLCESLDTEGLCHQCRSQDIEDPLPYCWTCYGRVGERFERFPKIGWCATCHQIECVCEKTERKNIADLVAQTPTESLTLCHTCQKPLIDDDRRAADEKVYCIKCYRNHNRKLTKEAEDARKYGRSAVDWLRKDADIWDKKDKPKREQIIVLQMLLELNNRGLLNFDIDEDTKKEVIEALTKIVRDKLDQKKEE